jgi:hypothetical protein
MREGDGDDGEPVIHSRRQGRDRGQDGGACSLNSEGVAVGYCISGMDKFHFSSRPARPSHGKKLLDRIAVIQKGGPQEGRTDCR